MGAIRSGLHIYSDRPIEGTSTPPLPHLFFKPATLWASPMLLKRNVL